jgi:hypothetical protein
VEDGGGFKEEGIRFNIMLIQRPYRERYAKFAFYPPPSNQLIKPNKNVTCKRTNLVMALSSFILHPPSFILQCGDERSSDIHLGKFS